MTVYELRRTAALLRTLAEVEVARIEGDDARVASLLDGVDPRDARDLAQRADFDAGVRAIYFRTMPAERRVDRTAW